MNNYDRFVLVCLFRIVETCLWSPKQCGCWFNETNGKLSDRIVGGFESIPHSWPWIVSIRKHSNNQPICGGTLISDRHILTAAHCFYDSLVNAKQSIGIYLFIIGAHYSTETHIYSDSVIRANASSIIIHEKYNSRRQTDDIALVILDQKVNFENIHLGAICLPNPVETDASDGTYVVAIGWGRLLETAIAASETLQQVLLVITEGQQCDRIKSGSQITTQLCAGSIDPKLSRDTCQGDSGGPLMTRNSDNRWAIVGITSYGKGCGRLNELGVYTRVDMYLNWIDQTIETFERYSSRSLNIPENIFFNSAIRSCDNLFLFLYFVILTRLISGYRYLTNKSNV